MRSTLPLCYSSLEGYRITVVLQLVDSRQHCLGGQSRTSRRVECTLEHGYIGSVCVNRESGTFLGEHDAVGHIFNVGGCSRSQ